jgi:hypothetical protein
MLFLRELVSLLFDVGDVSRQAVRRDLADVVIYMHLFHDDRMLISVALESPQWAQNVPVYCET